MRTPSLKVSGGSFFRLECDHEQLFHTEYKRSNRTKGLKILRCFPHCCPEHIDRSYCGSPLSVSVRLAESPVPTEPLMLSVFARFETVSDVSLRLGDCVEVDKIHRDVQTENNLDGQWIAGVLNRPSEFTLICTTKTLADKSLVFHLNQACSRWYYDWESGANKAQRLMKHTLKAYVVERVALDMDNNYTSVSRDAYRPLYRVLYIITSPDFTVVSYRRAPLETLPKYGTLQVSKKETVQRKSKTLPWRDIDQLAHRNVNRNPPIVRAKIPLQPQQPQRIALEVAFSVQDKLFWEHANASAVAVSKNIALLVAFVRWVPLRLYAPFVNDLVHSIELTMLDEPKRNWFSRLMLQYAHIGENVRHAQGTTLAFELEIPLRTASQSVLWLFSKETRRWICSFFHQNAANVLDKKAMRLCFLEFLNEIEKRLNAQVFAATSVGNLCNMAEKVIAAVYSQEYFRYRRPQVRQILSGQSFAGWNLFVLQLRDTYISTTSFKRAMSLKTLPLYNEIEREWNGNWQLDFNLDLIEFTVSDISLLVVAEVVSQLVELELTVNIREYSVRVQAPQSLGSCMHLILDGKDRVFRVFPNGISSCIGDGAFGDYCGEMRVESSGQLIIFFETFKWSIEESYHVRTRIECSSDRLIIEGDVLVTTNSRTFLDEDIPYIGEMSVRAKRKSVEEASARCYHAGGDHVGPWAKYEDFRLVYRKVHSSKVN